MLLGLIRDRRPDYLAIAMDDRDEAVFRREIDPNYKAHRDPAPEELHIQADRIGSIMTAMNLPICRVPGFEAELFASLMPQRAVRNDPVAKAVAYCKALSVSSTSMQHLSRFDDSRVRRFLHRVADGDVIKVEDGR